MKKVECYFNPMDSMLHVSDQPGAFCICLTPADAQNLKEIEEVKPEHLNVIPEELIMLKKAGFSAQEIIELKQSKVL